MIDLEIVGKSYDLRIDQTKFESSLDIEIPGYRIIGRCGGGSTANVYVAIQKSLGRQVALKVMHTALSDNEQSTSRFIKEGLVNAKLVHPNIVTIHDVGTTDEYHYIAMEYLAWGNLRQRLVSKLEFEWIVKVTKQIAKALAYAHENGFVHRDIKPENILFRDEDSAVLSDFGIATVSHSHVQISDRCNFGTPRYMSPEQINLHTIGPSSDVYSLGVVFFEMLTGLPPYNNGDSKAIRNAHLHDPIPALSKEYQYLQPLINKMLAKQAEDRISTAHKVIDILDQMKNSNSVLAGPEYLGENISVLKPRETSIDDLEYLNAALTYRPRGDLYDGYSKLSKSITSLLKNAIGFKINGDISIKKHTLPVGKVVLLSVILGLTSLALLLVYLNERVTIPKSNTIVQQETQKAHNKYVGWALHHLENNELKRAKYFIQKAREINPNDLISQEVLAVLDSQDNSKIVANKFSNLSNSIKDYELETTSVTELLNRAKQQVLNKNLTTPPNNNAYDTYQQILRAEPNNSDAIAGIAMIKKSYVSWAEQDLKNNNHHRAILFYKKALAIDPADTKLVQALKTLKLSRETSQTDLQV